MALKIDEELAEAHASLGHAMLHNWEWSESEKEFKRAIELNPNYPSAHHWYSEYLAAMGRLGEAIGAAKRARDLDPLSLAISADLSDALYLARRYDESIEEATKTLEMDPHFWLSHINLGRSYTEKGMHEEAIRELHKAGEGSTDRTEVLSFLGFAYAAAGQRDEGHGGRIHDARSPASPPLPQAPSGPARLGGNLAAHSVPASVSGAGRRR